jgi:GT2 family glycosyltransferase
VAVAGPRVIRSSGRLEPTAALRPTFANQVVETFGLFLLSRWVPAWRSAVLRQGVTEPTAVDVITACCVAIPRWAFEKVGAFDESFFMYVEDVDWCVRARQAGFEVHYLPQFEVVHDRGHGGANASLTPIDGDANIERYFEKHGVPHSKTGLRWLRRFHYLTRMIWMAGKAVIGQRGASSEVKRFWLSLVRS